MEVSSTLVKTWIVQLIAQWFAERKPRDTGANKKLCFEEGSRDSFRFGFDNDLSETKESCKASNMQARQDFHWKAKIFHACDASQQ
jgi:hypothetical protein